jgi:D-sedoheptulose 7-phosphate isomerase
MFNIKNYIDKHIQTTTKIYYSDSIRADIQAAADIILAAFQSGNKLLLCGNGGSAADAQHLAAELVPMGLPAIALTTDTSALTAIGNDLGFDRIFIEQVKSIGNAGDVLLGITTSGKSVNVRWALSQAMLQGLKTIALTGKSGLASTATVPTVTIAVPSKDTQHVQESHLMICHILWKMVDENN